MRVAEPAGGAHALIGARRRHTDVGDDNIGQQLVDELHQLRFVRRGADDLEVVLAVDELMESLAEQRVVLGKDDPDSHVHILLAIWWAVKDLNLRRLSRQIYSLLP